MKSRVHPTYKTKYRVANWAAYDRALVRRGDLTIWFSAEAVAKWEPTGVGKRGGQLKYSDLAIETALTLRLLFYLPLRQAEGFLNALFGLIGLELAAPDHTTLSRRGRQLEPSLRRIPTGEGIHLIVDSTSTGEGPFLLARVLHLCSAFPRRPRAQPSATCVHGDSGIRLTPRQGSHRCPVGSQLPACATHPQVFFARHRWPPNSASSTH